MRPLRQILLMASVTRELQCLHSQSKLSMMRQVVISEFTQQDGRKKRTAKRLCITNVTGLLLTCFVVIFTYINVFWSFTKRSV